MSGQFGTKAPSSQRGSVSAAFSDVDLQMMDVNTFTKDFLSENNPFSSTAIPCRRENQGVIQVQICIMSFENPENSNRGSS